MLCRIPAYLRLPQIKDLPSNIGFEPIRSFKKLSSLYLLPSGKGYFAAKTVLARMLPLCSNLQSRSFHQSRELRRFSEHFWFWHFSHFSLSKFFLSATLCMAIWSSLTICNLHCNLKTFRDQTVNKSTVLSLRNNSMVCKMQCKCPYILCNMPVLFSITVKLRINCLSNFQFIKKYCRCDISWN